MLRIESSAFQSDSKTSTQQRDITVTANSQRGHVRQLSESQSQSTRASGKPDVPIPWLCLLTVLDLGVVIDGLT